MNYLQDFIGHHRIVEKELISELDEHSYITKHKKGEYLIKEGSYIKLLKIVVEGRVRVYQQNEDKEILVYYLDAMETCVLSLLACFNSSEHSKSDVNVVAVEDLTVLNIPVRLVNEWSFKYKSWHNFTINTFKENINVMSFNYSQLAFEPLKERLYNYLMNQSQNQTIQLSHANLARELGTTREVVSRLLKKLAQEGKVELGKKHIQILK